MGINFPASPTVGQKYPQPAVAGIPVYTWDGEKWTTVGGSVAAYAPPADAIPLMDQPVGAVGVGTDYAREDHVHPISTSTDLVKTVPQTLTAPQQQQARQNVYAAPFDAMAYSGLQINGGMEVSQENGATAVTSTSGAAKYIVDGWKVASIGSQVVNSYQTLVSIAGFKNGLQLQTITANASLGAGDVCYVQGIIEGYRTIRLGWGAAGALPVTLAFWAAATRPGTYSGSIVGTGRSYPFSFTISGVNTWEYKTVTIPGDTAGTWAKDNTAGLSVLFCVMSGSSYLAPANAWIAGSYYGVTGTINGVAATSDNFLITGVTVLPGNEAPSAARSPFVMRPYDQELVTCKRYWEYASGSYRAMMPASAFLGTHAGFKVSKRAVPTCAFFGNGSTIANSTFGAFYGQTTEGTALQFAGTANTDSYNYGFVITADARL